MFVLPVSRVHSRPSPARAVDESFDRFFVNAVAPKSARVPALDVSETDSAYQVSLDVPGVGRDELKVSIEGRRVSVESVRDARPPVVDAAANGHAAGEAGSAEAARVLYRERGIAPYARTVSLPSEVDQAASQAKLENGVLTLTLAKKVKTGATQLPIA